MATRRPKPEDRFQYYPDLTFWYGLTPEEIFDMPRPLRVIYVESLERLRAEALNDAITASSFAKLKKDQRSRIARGIERAMKGARRAPADVKPDETPPDPESFKAGMAAIGISVQEVSGDA